MNEEKPLTHWLWELVRGDLDRRDLAAKEISAIFSGAMSGELPFSFDEAIRQAASSEGFEARSFVLALSEFLPQAQAQRMELWREQQAREDKITDRILERRGENPSETERETAARRLRKVICSSSDEKNAGAQTQSRLSNQQLTASLVFNALGETLLLAPETLRAMLRASHLRHNALRALEKIGAPAAPFFADELLAELDAATSPRGFDAPVALAAMIESDAARVLALVARLDAPNGYVASGAAQTLFYLGENAARLAPECVAKLQRKAVAPRDENSPLGYQAIVAMGKVGRGNERAAETLLAISREDDVWRKGVALSALGDCAARADLAVPRLIEALDDYREPDPDFTYQSRHERVTEALQAFGEKAAPAVPALLRHLRGDEIEGAFDQGVMETLATIGAAAREALPVLEALSRELEYDAEDLADEDDALSRALKNLST